MSGDEFKRASEGYHIIALGCYLAAQQSRYAPDSNPGARAILWTYAANNIILALDNTTSEVQAQQAAFTANLAHKILDSAPQSPPDLISRLSKHIRQLLERVLYTHGVGDMPQERPPGK